MGQHDTTWWVGFGFGAVAGSLMVGALLGLIPLILGQFVGFVRLGRIAFLVTVVAAFLGGFFLAVPSTIGFTITILFRWHRGKSRATGGAPDGA